MSRMTSCPSFDTMRERSDRIDMTQAGHEALDLIDNSLERRELAEAQPRFEPHP
jgi:hypothetical protein